jgi:uncharacterized protein YecE (DUF72 family)
VPEHEPIRVGTVDLPARTGWDRYFGGLTYLELSGLFSAQIKSATMARWRAQSPARSLGLVAPWPITHRSGPTGARAWPSDAQSGEFREGPAALAALDALAAAAVALGAATVVFQAPADHSPSATSRDQLERFFTERARADRFGGATRVWLPGGLWEPATALAIAAELDIVCGIDPLVRSPEGVDLAPLIGPRVYLRPIGFGRAGTLSVDRLEEIVDLVTDRESGYVVFGTGERLADARNLVKLLEP